MNRIRLWVLENKKAAACIAGLIFVLSFSYGWWSKTQFRYEHYEHVDPKFAEDLRVLLPQGVSEEQVDELLVGKADAHKEEIPLKFRSGKHFYQWFKDPRVKRIVNYTKTTAVLIPALSLMPPTHKTVRVLYDEKNIAVEVFAHGQPLYNTGIKQLTGDELRKLIKENE